MFILSYYIPGSKQDVKRKLQLQGEICHLQVDIVENWYILCFSNQYRKFVSMLGFNIAYGHNDYPTSGPLVSNITFYGMH